MKNLSFILLLLVLFGCGKTYYKYNDYGIVSKIATIDEEGATYLLTDKSVFYKMNHNGRVEWKKKIDSYGAKQLIKDGDNFSLLFERHDGILIYNMDKNGNFLNEKRIKEEHLRDMQIVKSSENGYIVGAEKNDYIRIKINGKRHAIDEIKFRIFKLDENKEMVWDIELRESFLFNLNKIYTHDNGDIFIFGDIFVEENNEPLRKMVVLVVDKNGKLKLKKIYGDGKNQIYKVLKQKDGFILLGGEDREEDYLNIIKVDFNGKTVIDKKEKINEYYYRIDLVKEVSKGFIFVDEDMRLFDNDGEEIWKLDYGKLNTRFNDVLDLGKEGYLFLFEEKYDLHLMKVDRDGKILWRKAYGDNWSEYGKMLVKSDDGGIIIFGEHREKTLIIKVDGNGELEKETKFIRFIPELKENIEKFFYRLKMIIVVG